ncbi:MAG: tetratricopeptide repeat protein [Azonexus sp.]|nr:tetratricopeptide repeat protein [Azonexus sp.]
MSLINEMLRNLEAKRPDDLARQNLQREIRCLPASAQDRGHWFRIILLVGFALVSLGGIWLQTNGRLLPLLGLQEVPGPVVVAPIPPPVEPQPSAAVNAPVEQISENLRLAQDLAALPTPVAPVLPVPDPVFPAPLAAAEVAKPTPQVYSGPVKIEKSIVLATPRDRADAEYRKAENAMAAGRNAEAMEALRAALKHDPAHVQVRQALLRQLLDQRKLEEAMTILQEGLEIQPAQTGWAMSLARLQLEQGDVAAADATLGRSQAYAEASADYAGFQGHLKSRLGAHQKAAAHYLRATRLSPREGRWWLGLGLALEADGRSADGKEALRRALATATLSAELAAVAEQHLR